MYHIGETPTVPYVRVSNEHTEMKNILFTEKSRQCKLQWVKVSICMQWLQFVKSEVEGLPEADASGQVTLSKPVWGSWDNLCQLSCVRYQTSESSTVSERSPLGYWALIKLWSVYLRKDSTTWSITRWAKPSRDCGSYNTALLFRTNPSAFTMQSSVLLCSLPLSVFIIS